MDYLETLTKAIGEAKELLEKELLVQLKKEYSLQETAVHGLLELMINKRLVHSDPYTYDNKMTEIELPEIGSFPDNEKVSVIGTRLSHYERMLEFVVNYYQFTCEYLSPKRISVLEKLAQVFHWDDFVSTSKSPNTSAIASIVDSSLNSTDNLSSSILRSSIAQLGKSLTTTKQILAKVSLYHREAYKVFIRNTVIPAVPQNTLAMDANLNDMFLSVKKTFSAKFRKNPFFQDLIYEVLSEDFSSSGENLRNDCLKKLKFGSSTKEQQKIEIDYRQVLLSGLKVLANSGSHFSMALEKVVFNEELINRETATFFSKLKSLFRKAFHLKEPEKEIIVLIDDPITQSRKKEIINLNSFQQAVEKKITIFQNIVNPSSQVVAKLNKISEQNLFENFSQYITDCNELIDKMAGLDLYYKTIKPAVRSKIKGIKIEITTIKNSIINANQYKAEYVGYQEEMYQKKKLGIQ